jgi:hypothetical protein
VKERNPPESAWRMSPFAFLANDRSPPLIAMRTVAISNVRFTSIPVIPGAKLNWCVVETALLEWLMIVKEATDRALARIGRHHRSAR